MQPSKSVRVKLINGINQKKVPLASRVQVSFYFILSEEFLIFGKVLLHCIELPPERIDFILEGYNLLFRSHIIAKVIQLQNLEPGE